MIKLAVDGDNAVFYFKKMKHCKKFMDVFEDHACNVPWKEPEKVSDDIDIDDWDLEALERNPKKRAEDDLDWGFALVKFLKIDFTESQKALVDQLTDQVLAE